METAQRMLRELEQKCATHNSTWLQSIRSIIFRGGTESPGDDNRSLVERLENQIVLADVQLCSAILTFLTQDISGMMRGSWLLKRAWKVYQSVYQQIYALYKDSVGCDEDDAVLLQHLNPKTFMRHSSSSSTVNTVSSDWSLTSVESNTVPSSTTTPVARKGIVQSFSEYFLSSPKTKQTGDFDSESEHKNKKWRRRSKKNKVPRSKSSPDGIQLEKPDGGGAAPSIDAQVIQRLMGAISFGYGAFQLAVSLLPPSMLKLVSFFGFVGDRDLGLSCLQFSRTTTDMRAPLSTIALLWYLTVGNQIFASENDDAAVMENNIAQVTAILQESDTEFAQSALFGFFKGRLSRMHKDLPGAIEHFEGAYYTSVLPELRLLCLHEMGWCRLIQLDCLNAIDEFHALRVNSEYSKSFFGYLTALCHGVVEKKEDLMEQRRDILDSIGGLSAAREQSQIDQFISKRILLFPDTEAKMLGQRPIFWRFLVYELLFLWNTLDTCSPTVLDQIVKDCETELSQEPIPGLAKLILATCERLRGNSDKAVDAYRDCLKLRGRLDENRGGETIANFTHISAFAHYKLAMLLMSDKYGRREEANQLLQTVQAKYKNYDFESRLSLRVHTAIKELSK